MSYSALAVANAFIELSLRENSPLTNMKLQKLVYFAHGFALALNHDGLFREPVRAFQWGPVIPDLYNAVKHYGSSPILKKIPLRTGELQIDLRDKDSSATQLIEMVWKKYGSFSAAQLSTITHRPGTPWSQVWNDTEFGVIPNDLIRYHYTSLVSRAA